MDGTNGGGGVRETENGGDREV